MDDFDDFLNQLPTTAPPPRVAPPQNFGDDLDSLLGEMENFQVPPPTYQQQQQPIQNNYAVSYQSQQTYNPQANDLDDLLGQLSSPISVPTRTTTTTTTKTVTTTTSLDDELDELMNLTEPDRKPPQVPAPVQSNPVDDLDDLMNQLGTPVQPQSNRPLTRQPSGVRIRGVINQQAKNQSPSTPPVQTDDVSSLINQFTAATANVSPRPLSTKVNNNPPSNELDDLLNEFSAPTPVVPQNINPRPISTKVVSTPSPSTNELDDLMSQLNVNASPRQMNVAPVSVSSNPRPVSSRGVSQPVPTNDLDDLMNEFNISTTPRTTVNIQTTTNITTTVSPSVGMDDLDDLMNSLSTPQPSAQLQSPQYQQSPQYRAPQSQFQSPQPQSYQPPSVQRTSVTVQQTRNVSPTPIVHNTTSELDDLLSSLETPSVPKVNPIVHTQSPSQNVRAAPSPTGLDDLDALMAGLNTPPTPISQRGSVPNANPIGGPISANQPRPMSSNFGAGGSPGRGQPPMANPVVGSIPGQYGRGQTPATNFTSPPINQFGGPMGSPMVGGPVPGRGQPPVNNFASPTAPLGRGIPPQQNSPVGRGVPPVGRGFGSPNQGAPPVGGRGRGFGADPSQLDQLLGSLSNQMNNIKDIEASKGVCHFCQKYIYAECMQAMGRVYHPDHFVCSSCQKPLGTNSFYETNGEPNCETCYQNMFCPRCAYCNQAIADRCINALNQKWHVNCFVCNSCCAPFPSGSFFERGGMPYCQQCFQGTFSSKCAGCGNMASGQLINALGAKWHPQCFCCSYCRRPFNGLPYFEKDGKPYCEQHYHTTAGSVCAGCRTAIVGRCVDALGKKWHPEHFVCSYCMNPLSGGGYTEQHGSPYCQECFANLF